MIRAMQLSRSNRLQALESYPFAVINEKVAELITVKSIIDFVNRKLVG